MHPSRCDWFTMGIMEDGDKRTHYLGGLYPEFKRWRGQPPHPFTKTGRHSIAYVRWVNNHRAGLKSFECETCLSMVGEVYITNNIWVCLECEFVLQGIPEDPQQNFVKVEDHGNG